MGIRAGMALLVGVSVLLLVSGNGASAHRVHLPRRPIVKVAGHAISQRTVDHWMFVAAKSQAAQQGGSPVIVPLYPPRFSRCIRMVRSKVPALDHTSTRILRKDCSDLFDTISHQALDYLIKAHWYLDLARADHIKITRAEVVRAFKKTRREQFRGHHAFRTFLRQTGQTVSDLLFRFRVNLAFTALLKRLHLGPSKGFHRLDREVRRRYRPRTTCARYYVMRDCANFHRARAR